MKRKLTESQQAATKARRAAFRVIVKQVADMTDEQRTALANRMMVVNTDQHTLSMTNQILVSMQCPTATIVGGFAQWKSQGRHIIKGQHSINIWIPGGKKETETEAEDLYFFMGNVFDISQTEATEVTA